MDVTNNTPTLAIIIPVNNLVGKKKASLIKPWSKLYVKGVKIRFIYSNLVIYK
jgi:hypothetical protein